MKQLECHVDFPYHHLKVAMFSMSTDAHVSISKRECPLADWLGRLGTTAGEAARAVLEAIEVVAEAHAMGAVHGALSPRLIVPGNPTLVRQAGDLALPPVGHPDALLVSRARWQGEEPTAVDDVYALGMLLAVIIHPDSQSWTAPELFVRASFAASTLPTDFGEMAPVEVAAVLVRATHPSPSARHANCADLVSALASAGFVPSSAATIALHPHKHAFQKRPEDLPTTRQPDPEYSQELEIEVDPKRFAALKWKRVRNASVRILLSGVFLVAALGAAYFGGSFRDPLAISIKMTRADSEVIDLSMFRAHVSNWGIVTTEYSYIAGYELQLALTNEVDAWSLHWRLRNPAHTTLAEGRGFPAFEWGPPPETTWTSVRTQVALALCAQPEIVALDGSFKAHRLTEACSEVTGHHLDEGEILTEVRALHPGWKLQCVGSLGAPIELIALSPDGGIILSLRLVGDRIDPSSSRQVVLVDPDRGDVRPLGWLDGGAAPTMHDGVLTLSSGDVYGLNGDECDIGRGGQVSRPGVPGGVDVRELEDGSSVFLDGLEVVYVAADGTSESATLPSDLSGAKIHAACHRRVVLEIASVGTAACTIEFPAGGETNDQ